MPDAPRDWDKDLAAIDKVIEKGGFPAPTGAGGVPVPAPAAARQPAPPAGGARERFGAWGRALLVAALGVALWRWPWRHTCGTAEYAFIGAALLLAIGGGWVLLVSWRRRTGLPHLLGLLALAWAAWLLTAEILPRTGYAKDVKTWTCPN